MRKGILSFLAVTTAAALSLTACGDGDSNDSGGSGSKGKVGVILPDTTSSVRYESFDRPYLEQAFKAAGVAYDIQNAEGSTQRFQTIADQMLNPPDSLIASVQPSKNPRCARATYREP